MEFNKQHNGNCYLREFIGNRVKNLSEVAHLIKPASNLSVKKIADTGEE